ncbi:MAG TPA: 16S rRNA (guanine(527)-N(7))-methyltransferase RsmG [Terriglobia bacterium]|nr:16S rRNA (guanine(527)-N(7))-methyltransferase RsmG [Terriglobia bacterium]
MKGMLTAAEVAGLLAPFGVSLDDGQVDYVLVYLDLLLRWNERINLTAVRSPEECVRRHFGESLFLGRWIELRGRLLDVGSGAGFPGLALKLISGEMTTVLLEPVAKKRSFLKEVVRRCSLRGVEVTGERLEEFARSSGAGQFDFVTMRAVGGLGDSIPLATRLLVGGGKLCLWLGKDQVSSAVGESVPLVWRDPIPIPLSRKRVLLIGERIASGL